MRTTNINFDFSFEPTHIYITQSFSKGQRLRVWINSDGNIAVYYIDEYNREYLTGHPMGESWEAGKHPELKQIKPVQNLIKTAEQLCQQNEL